MIRYVSTRGAAQAVSFDEAVLAGLAPDGGLYVPDHVPAFTLPEIAAMQSLSYAELAYAIISRFVGDSVAPEALEAMIAESYATFDHPAVVPLSELDAHTFLLELFHGPTLAFKDFALQFLGRLLDYLLEKKGSRATVLGATSGDTGSAAIAGCAGRARMDIVILHPKGRVSEVQRRQMTTVADENVHNLAVEGTFDDCQNIVKTLFQNNPSPQRGEAGRGASGERSRDSCPPPTLPPMGGGNLLVAVNSINWARIAAQVVYYFHAALALGAPARAVGFAVPTGNFGDIYAGHVARRMGLPVAQLIIATNTNDILARTLETGVYGVAGVTPTLSPSMDIQVSSNFERLLFELYGRPVNEAMAEFARTGKLALPAAAFDALKREFSACSVSDEDTKKTIAEVHASSGLLLDPHSAVGLSAGLRRRRDTAAPLVVLATAHPAKFPDAVEAACGVRPALPARLADLLERKERFETVANDSLKIKRYIDRHVAVS